MATDTESFNRDLYDLLKVRGYDPTPLDSKNQRVAASQDADVIEFTFRKDGEDYGSVWITVDDAQNIIIYYDQEQQESPSTKTPGVDYDDTWTGLLKFLKNWAQRRQMSFELQNKDRLGDDMRQRDYYKMKEKLGESYHPMGKKASYNDAVPSVKIILQHNRALEEGEQRYRNVARIFLENQDGERFLAPTNKPGLARVYARHIAEGGVPNDEKWNHIKSICEDYAKMAGFVRATRNGQFNESAQALVNEGVNHYNNLRETLHKLAGHRGYQAYFESWTPTLMEGEGEDLSEMFMSQSLDPRIESAMPILSRLKKPVTEMEEVDTLAEWADSIISEKLELEEAVNDYTVSAMPKFQPKKVKASSRDEAIEKAAKMWGIPAGKITLHGSEDGSDEPSSNDEKDAAPDDGTAIDRATQRAKNPKDPWYKPLANPDDLWNIGKLAIGLGEEEDLEEMDKMSGSRRDFDNPRGPDKTAKPVKAKDFAKKALKSLKRGMKGWEKGMHDVDTVKAATKSLSPDQKEKALAAKAGKGSPAELQQKLIKREKNKKVDESDAEKNAKDTKKTFPNVKHLTKGGHPDWKKHGINAPVKDEVDEATGWYDEKHPQHDRMTKDGYEHSVHDIQGKKMHRYYKPGSLTDLYKYDDEEVKEAEDKQGDDYKAWRKKNFNDKKTTDDIIKGSDTRTKYDLDEDLGPEQKRVGQLGPTEKVKNNNIGKLVGASESREIDPELARIIEMAKFKR